MIAFEDAMKIIGSEPVSTAIEETDLNASLGRVLAEDVISDTDMPPFDRSAMDGYACRRSDLGERLEIVGTITAGGAPGKPVGKNQCTKIMTGAQVPDGADCVVMVEHTINDGDNHVIFTGSQTADNISFRAEDVWKGDVLLSRGCLIRPQHIAILASAGCTSPVVYVMPRITVLTTGNEIVEPCEKLAGSLIRNSNGPQLMAQVRMAGGHANYGGIVRDTKEDLHVAVKAAVEASDIVIITGGVSMGDFDFVPAVLKDYGIRLFFEKVAVKPGRPTLFGRKDDVFVFGLPGNPVSSFTIFELMVKPLIYRMMGYAFSAPVIKLPMGVDFSRRKADRISWIPVIVDKEGQVFTANYHGSAHIHALHQANGMLGVPAGIFSYKKGDIVNVRQI
ncbi:MAG: gephyrin-like molybdotransferase Glp [Bacteroidales bacterium]